ncbi:MAG: RNA 2',3'-cyclic phosphodiesterase [Actinomycetota bacterium]
MVAPSSGRPKLFIAVELPVDLRRKLGGLVDRFRGTRGVRWVVPENYHLTLRFLGPTATADIPRLAEVLAALASRSAASVAEVTGFGSFPGGERTARVLLARVQETGGSLTAWAAGIERVIPGVAGPFTPHVTLGRCDPARTAPEGWTATRVRGGTFAVTGWTLYRSRIGGGPATYEALEVFPFRA